MMSIPSAVQERRLHALWEVLPLIDRHLGGSRDWFTINRFAPIGGGQWATWTAAFSTDLEALGKQACEAQMNLSVPAIEDGLAQGYTNANHVTFALAHRRSLAFKESGLRPWTSQMLHRTDLDRVFSLKLNAVQIDEEHHIEAPIISSREGLAATKGFVRWTPNPVADLAFKRSRNWGTGQDEAGLSTLDLHGRLGPERATLSYRCLPGKAYVFAGRRVGIGTDGEDLIEPDHVIARVDDGLVAKLVDIHGAGPHHLPPERGPTFQLAQA